MNAKRAFNVLMVLALLLLTGWSRGTEGEQAATRLELKESWPEEVADWGQNVELVGQIGGSVRAVAIQGTLAYVGVGPRLVILVVSLPANPAVVGMSDVLPGIVYGVAVSGSYAYVADYAAGLRIINVSDPSAASQVGFYDTPGYARGVAVAGSYAYVADGGSDLRIIDVTNPANPVTVESSATVTLTMDDNGEPGSTHTIGFTLMTGGALLFSSNWTGTMTAEKVLIGGNLVVH